MMRGRHVERCSKCGRTRDDVVLHKCVVCHQHFCRTCGVRKFGKQFCSGVCADYFFFGDED